MCNPKRLENSEKGYSRQLGFRHGLLLKAFRVYDLAPPVSTGPKTLLNTPYIFHLRSDARLEVSRVRWSLLLTSALFNSLGPEVMKRKGRSI